jgi:O-antigen/teichoic acid export membrane protein
MGSKVPSSPARQIQEPQAENDSDGRPVQESSSDGGRPGSSLTSHRHLARNTLWNLIGYLAPLIVAVLVVPLLIRHLGTAKYGILTIAWSVVGYFGIFDMGLSNALAKFIAERVGHEDEGEIQAIFQTGFLLLTASSILAGIGLALIAHPLAYRWLNVSVELRPDAYRVFLIFALVLPFVVSVASFRGTLSAYQRFDLMNKVQIATGIFSFGSPAVVLLFSHGLVPIVSVIALCRVGSWLAYLYCCAQVLPSFDFAWHARKALVKPLITFGGWISVCNVTEPFFLYSDRFILASLVSVSAVAYYATPFDVMVRLWAIPDALNSALFPLYAAGLRNNTNRVLMLFERAGHYIFPLTFAPVLFAVLFASDILGLWINPAFAAHSAVVLKWIAVGVLFSCMARVPWTLLVAYRPDLPAKLVTFEAPVYVTGLYLMINHFGLPGAAIAWATRTAFNCSILHAMTWLTMPGSARAVKKNGALLIMAIVVLSFTSLVPSGVAARGLYWAFALAACMSLTWFFVLSAEERAELKPALLIG